MLKVCFWIPSRFKTGTTLFDGLSSSCLLDGISSIEISLELLLLFT